MSKNKEYLGDGVYASHDGYQFRLTTEDGGEWPSNEIFLEPTVFDALIQYAAKIAARPAQAGSESEEACD